MLQSLRVSEAGMLAQQNKIEVVANNLANATTPGFKRLITTLQAVDPAAPGFNGQLQNGQLAGGLPGGQLDVMLPGSLLRVGTSPDLSTGSWIDTGNRTDVALDGQGMFVVKADGQDQYTRNGSFVVSAEGKLTTRAGHEVQGDGGPIEVPPAAVVEIALDGTIRANGDDVGRLKIVQPNAATDMTPVGDSNFALRPGAEAPAPAAENSVRVQAGFLEASNANPVSELVAMITAQRIFEAGQRVLSAADETLRKATNDIPRTR